MLSVVKGISRLSSAVIVMMLIICVSWAWSLFCFDQFSVRWCGVSLSIDSDSSYVAIIANFERVDSNPSGGTELRLNVYHLWKGSGAIGRTRCGINIRRNVNNVYKEDGTKNGIETCYGIDLHYGLIVLFIVCLLILTFLKDRRRRDVGFEPFLRDCKRT